MSRDFKKEKGSVACEFILAFAFTFVAFLLTVRFGLQIVSNEIATYKRYSHERRASIYNLISAGIGKECEDNPPWFIKGEEEC